MTARCFTCKATVLSVPVLHARTSEVLLVDPEPDDTGDVQIRRTRMGWDGRTARPGSAPLLGFTRHKRHTCETPLEVGA